MSLYLSKDEQVAIGDAIRVLASPFNYAKAEEWLGEAAAHVRRVLGGVMCWYQMPDDDEIISVGQTFSDAQLEQYREFEPLFQKADYFERSKRLQVYTRSEVFGPAYEDVAESPYVHEYLRPAGVGDSLAMSVPVCAPPTRQRDIAQIISNVGYGEEPYTASDVQKARLLFPAMQAGVAAYYRLRSVRGRMHRLLDRSGGACAVFGSNGILLHLTPALKKALKQEPRRDELTSRIRQLAISFESDDGVELSDAARAVRYTGVSGAYTLVPTRVRDVTLRPAVVVTVKLPHLPSLPSAEQLQDRYGLTPQEARVTRHLAQRRTNKEIADALCISVHTARHHVRHALEKIGVGRREVKADLCGGVSCNGK